MLIYCAASVELIVINTLLTRCKYSDSTHKYANSAHHARGINININQSKIVFIGRVFLTSVFHTCT